MTTAESIHLHCVYTLLFVRQPPSGDDNELRFTETHKSGRTASIALLYSTGTATVSMTDVSAADAVVDELRTLGMFDGPNLSEAARATIIAPIEEIHASLRKLLSLMRYHLRYFDIAEGYFSIKSERWCRASESAFHDVPRTISSSWDSFSTQPLDEPARKAIQAALDGNALPLVAMRHLHRAKHERQPHHKWIDATTAAELAIKEVLCRAHPAMEVLLMEMPSPPFAKMYGSLLRHYLGEESPFRKQLVKGQEKRNTLVHRPRNVQIDPQEANDYVSTVESAIFHLLSLLYPNDTLIRFGRSRCVSNDLIT